MHKADDIHTEALLIGTMDSKWQLLMAILLHCVSGKTLPTIKYTSIFVPI